MELINTETELDENESGAARTFRGKVVFENVSFGYEPGVPVLEEVGDVD